VCCRHLGLEELSKPLAARASLVALAPLGQKAEYLDLIDLGCRTVIRRYERFAKTAVGWMLRDACRRRDLTTACR
jgi:hypothetical protein